MTLIPKTTCRRCRRQFSSLKSKCPYCGTRKTRASTRTAQPSAAAVPESRAAARAESNSKWQMIFSGVILAAVVLAVIALISVSLHNRGAESSGGKQPGSSGGKDNVISVETSDEPEAPAATPVIVTAKPVETPTPTPEPEDEITSLEITFLGSKSEGFAMNPGDTIQLAARTYPLDAEVTVTWSSANTGIMQVNENGLVTGISSGNTTLSASAGGITTEIPVWVR